MKLSVCLIVKNEEKVIRRCLECVKKVADEIVITDTSSTDDTKSICKEYTDKIYDFEWNYDFSKARNFCISHASGDYVMWIDADDVIYEEDIRLINEIKKEEKPFDTYMLEYVLSEDEKGNPEFYFYRERIMKKCARLKFNGFIHEVVTPFGSIAYRKARIRHKKIGCGDPTRNLNIYERHLSCGEKLDARNTYYYAKELYYNGKYEKCVKYLNDYLKMNDRFAPDEIDCYKTLSRCESDDLKALNLLFELLRRFTPDAETVCLIAERFSSLNQSDAAETYYRFALACEREKASGFIDSRYYRLIPLLSLVVLCYKKGDYEGAKRYHELSKSLYPENEKVVYNDKFF